MAMEDKPLEDVAPINGLIAKYDFRSSHSGKVTREQAGAMAEKLGAMRLHLCMGSMLLEGDIDFSEAFLANLGDFGRWKQSLAADFQLAVYQPLRQLPFPPP
jgi:hypothetical protein